MTIKKPHKHSELIKLWADGAEIEYRILQGFNGNEHWSEWFSTDKDTVSWTESENWEFRIKPATKPDVIEFYVKMPFTELQMQGADFEWVSENGKKCPQLKVIWDGETGELKDAEVIK